MMFSIISIFIILAIPIALYFALRSLIRELKK